MFSSKLLIISSFILFIISIFFLNILISFSKSSILIFSDKSLRLIIVCPLCREKQLPIFLYKNIILPDQKRQALGCKKKISPTTLFHWNFTKIYYINQFGNLYNMMYKINYVIDMFYRNF